MISKRLYLSGVAYVDEWIIIRRCFVWDVALIVYSWLCTDVAYYSSVGNFSLLFCEYHFLKLLTHSCFWLSDILTIFLEVCWFCLSWFRSKLDSIVCLDSICLHNLRFGFDTWTHSFKDANMLILIPNKRRRETLAYSYFHDSI